MKWGLTTRIAPLLMCIFLIAMGPGAPAGGGRETPSFPDREGIVGQKAPDFTLKDLNGKNVSLSAFHGKIVFLNFWATWCPPCKAEMPSFQKLLRDEHGRGIEVIAISADRSARDVSDYLSKNRFDIIFVMDENTSVTKRYRVFSMPTTFLIDRNGVVAEKFMGEYDWSSSEIRKKLDNLQ